jgi:hypothetical protein
MDSIHKPGLPGLLLMTVATLVYGIIPPLVDLTETHVFHHDWTPHSRMHMVWLLGTNSLISITSLYFLWLHKSDRLFGVRLAGILGICVYSGFWLSAASMSLYNGSLSDKLGVPTFMGIDGNVITFSLALLILLSGWYLARKKYS